MRAMVSKTDRARRLRRDSTDAEQLLWRHLRNRAAIGAKFRRQHPIGPYVVDFVCLERRLIIEIDGGQHATIAEQDTRRTDWLESEGYRALRFWNNEVLEQTEAVVVTIRAALRAD